MHLDPQIWEPRNLNLVLLLAVFAIGAVAFGDKRWYGDPVAYFLSIVFGACPWYVLGLFPLCYMLVSLVPQITVGLFAAFVVTAPVQWVLMTQLSSENSPTDINHEDHNKDLASVRQTMAMPFYCACHLIQLWLVNPVRASDRQRYRFLPIANVLFQLSLCSFGWYWILKRWRNEKVDDKSRRVFVLAVNMTLSASNAIWRKTSELSSLAPEVHDISDNGVPNASA